LAAVYSAVTAVLARQQLASYIKYKVGVPENVGADCVGKPWRVILFDLLNDVYSKQVCDLFSTGGHHRNISVILITQNLFHQGRYC